MKMCYLIISEILWSNSPNYKNNVTFILKLIADRDRLIFICILIYCNIMSNSR